MRLPAEERQSKWIAFERCLALLHRLMRGSATSDELKDIVEHHAEGDQSVEKSSVEKRFEKDRKQLRDFFGAEVGFRRGEKVYRLNALDHPLIDLPLEAVRGFAFLQAIFSDEATPMQPQIKGL